MPEATISTTSSSGLSSRSVTSSTAHWPCEKGPRETSALEVMGAVSGFAMAGWRGAGEGGVGRMQHVEAALQALKARGREAQGGRTALEAVLSRGCRRRPLISYQWDDMSSAGGERGRNGRSLSCPQQRFSALLFSFSATFSCSRSACRQSFLTRARPAPTSTTAHVPCISTASDVPGKQH